jgi:hypothetical protein
MMLSKTILQALVFVVVTLADAQMVTWQLPGEGFSFQIRCEQGAHCLLTRPSTYCALTPSDPPDIEEDNKRFEPHDLFYFAVPDAFIRGGACQQGDECTITCDAEPVCQCVYAADIEGCSAMSLDESLDAIPCEIKEILLDDHIYTEEEFVSYETNVKEPDILSVRCEATFAACYPRYFGSYFDNITNVLEDVFVSGYTYASDFTGCENGPCYLICDPTCQCEDSSSQGNECAMDVMDTSSPTDFPTEEGAAMQLANNAVVHGILLLLVVGLVELLG